VTLDAVRLHRRKKVTSLIHQKLPWLKIALFEISYSWMLCTPLPFLENRSYVNENVLQPGQVNTYWNWGDVHNADLYLHH
jgi:GPI-anchor transamidase subunit GAA1